VCSRVVSGCGLTDVAGVYGDVLRVKILFNKKDTALIQFVDATQAQRGTRTVSNVLLQSYFLSAVRIQLPLISTLYYCCSLKIHLHVAMQVWNNDSNLQVESTKGIWEPISGDSVGCYKNFLNLFIYIATVQAQDF